MVYRKGKKYKGNLVPNSVLRKVGKQIYKKKGNDYASNKMVVYKNLGERMFMPPKFKTILTQNTMCALQAGAALQNWYTIKMNSIFDPFDTAKRLPSGVAAPLDYNISPAGSNKFSELYENYRVTACKINLMTIPTSTADEIVYAIAPALDATLFPTSAPLSVDQAASVPHSKGPQYSSTYFKSSLSKYLRVKHLLGNKISGDLTEYESKVDADPKNTLRWVFAYRTLSGNAVSAGQSVSIVVKLTYYVEYFNLKTTLIAPGS